LFRGHTATVLDTDWCVISRLSSSRFGRGSNAAYRSPFDDSFLASSSDDGKVWTRHIADRKELIGLGSSMESTRGFQRAPRSGKHKGRRAGGQVVGSQQVSVTPGSSKLRDLANKPAEKLATFCSTLRLKTSSPALRATTLSSSGTLNPDPPS